MIKKKQEIVSYSLGFLALGMVIFFIIYASNPDLFGTIFPEEFYYKFHWSHKLSIEREKIFEIMSNVTSYPKIFPERYNSLKIINQSENVIFTEEDITYGNLNRKLIVKHTLVENESHLIEIVKGDAKNTKILLNYKSVGNSTNILVDFEINLMNIRIEPGMNPSLKQPSMLPRGGFQGEISRILEKFGDVANKFE